MSNLKRNNNTSDDSINNHTSFNKKTDKEQLFINKCEVLANTILNLQPLYLNEEYDDKQRAYIETMVGAGLWYLSKGIWTGNMGTEKSWWDGNGCIFNARKIYKNI